MIKIKVIHEIYSKPDREITRDMIGFQLDLIRDWIDLL